MFISGGSYRDWWRTSQGESPYWTATRFHRCGAPATNSRTGVLTQFVEHGSEPRADHGLIACQRKPADAATNSFRSCEIHSQQGADKFQILQSARSQFAHDQIIELQTQGGDPTCPQRLQPRLP